MTTRKGRGRPSPAVVAVAVVMVAVVILGWALLRRTEVVTPTPGQQRCVARAADHTVAVDLGQAHYASIIAGVSVDRGLPPRAASIALATAYQESAIRNLDHGDRDSVGLFQQRPSQGWGTVKEIMDPYYATDTFYDALVKIDGWQSGDINDVAQQVQRSGFPEAYRDHEADGRTLASVLTGHSSAALSCLERRDEPGDAVGLASVIDETFSTANPDRDGTTLTITAKSGVLAWAYGQFAVANAAAYGVASVRVADLSWTGDRSSLAEWQTDQVTPAPAADRTVVITVRD